MLKCSVWCRSIVPPHIVHFTLGRARGSAMSVNRAALCLRQGSCRAWVNRAEVRGGHLRGSRGLSIVLLLCSDRSVNCAAPYSRRSSSVCGGLSVNRAAARRSLHLWAQRSSIVRTVRRERLGRNREDRVWSQRKVNCAFRRFRGRV